MKINALSTLLPSESEVEFLPWDSSFLGIKVGKITKKTLDRKQLTSLLTHFWALGGGLVYWASNPDDIPSQKAATANHGLLVDIKTIYAIQMIQSPSVQGKAEIYDGPVVNQELETLALQAGEYSRFKIDSRMPKNAHDRLYRLWMSKSVSGELADAVLIRRDGERIVAMITVEARTGCGTIGLVAVDPRSRGRGLGRDLIVSAISWFKDHGCKLAKVVTQGANQAACRFYETSGFSLQHREAFYHFWKDEP
jgi:dTDP-4-amino-4,6-dideoxy-D-galactose acyltransferase